MDRFDEPYFYARKGTDEHEAEIYQSRGLTSEYERLIGRVFEHQPAVYDVPEWRGDSELPDTDLLSSYFYRSCYLPPRMVRGFRGAPVSVDEFVEDVVFRPLSGTRNALSYLMGDVGVGKTALINHLLTIRSRAWIEDNSRWFVRVDCEGAGMDESPSCAKLMNAIADKTSRVLTQRPELLGVGSAVKRLLQCLASGCPPPDVFGYTKPPASSFQQQAQLFARLVTGIWQDTGRSLVLIIDNLDLICLQTTVSCSLLMATRARRTSCKGSAT